MRHPQNCVDPVEACPELRELWFPEGIRIKDIMRHLTATPKSQLHQKVTKLKEIMRHLAATPVSQLGQEVTKLGSPCRLEQPI